MVGGCDELAHKDEIFGLQGEGDGESRVMVAGSGGQTGCQLTNSSFTGCYNILTIFN